MARGTSIYLPDEFLAQVDKAIQQERLAHPGRLVSRSSFVREAVGCRIQETMNRVAKTTEGELHHGS
jgi:metal-responsive CopG/Arc/MetJ family transcriptional regulator